MQKTTNQKLLPYDAAVFQGLQDFFVARDDLPKHRDNITSLGDVICNFELEKHLGLNLLHKHFEIAADEIVVREFADDAALIRPYKIGEPGPLVPYLWILAEGCTGKGFYPVEFVAFSDEVLRREALAVIETINGTEGFLDSLARELEELGTVELFGISGLFSRSPFVLDEDMSLLETSDESNRVLTLRPTRKTVIKTEDTTQTLWTFIPPPRGAARPESACMSHCVSHCHNHGINPHH
ncbi:MAG TPA: hypothetical protein VJU61_01930 [Polyangiaceae bacterium]|nr:hypothetical protein [Polyangiaceae bacterium]